MPCRIDGESRGWKAQEGWCLSRIFSEDDAGNVVVIWEASRSAFLGSHYSDDSRRSEGTIELSVLTASSEKVGESSLIELEIVVVGGVMIREMS